MTRARLALVATLVALALLSVATPSSAVSPPLEVALRRALVGPGLEQLRTAAVAVDLQTGAAVYSANGELALHPASAEKLPVSFAALRLLGPAYRFHTDVLGDGELVRHRWEGDLVLVGLGDPTLAAAGLDSLARQVASFGIRRVSGRVLGDESYFDPRRDAPGWKSSFVGIESRPLGALSVEDVPFPGSNGAAAAAAHAFTAALERRGVAVRGAPAAGHAPDGVFPLAASYSEPLVEIVRHMNRESDNFAAEMLLKALGATVAREGSTRAGARVVQAELRAAGVPTRGLRIVDGSGLSRRDRLTPESLVAILRRGASDPAIRDAFVTSLSVAGISGTLEHRLDRRPTRGRVIAKTGTTNAASALAGFVRRRYVFAILQNGSPVPWWTARAAQDRFVTILARS